MQSINSRMIVLQQKNSGAGIARNTGMKAAKGEYLSILDSDDFFEPDMLQKAYRQCKKDDADICVFRSDRCDTQLGKYEAIPWTIQQKYLPEHVPFSPQDIDLYLFQIFNGWSWDKLYRREVVVKSGLTFQGLRTTNDAFFVFLMNLQAKRITIIDEVLAHHRVNLNTSLSVTREKSWDCCWRAISAIREELIKPMVYVIKGFREAFVTGNVQNPGYTIYFWSCVIVLFAAGSYVQDRLKKYYADFV